ncbi:MAG: DNA polymerase III subunit delta [Oceanicaulis sp.]
MKVSAREAERAVSRPSPGARIFLIYGPDSGLVRERATMLAKNLVPDPDDPFAVTRLTEDDLKSDPASLPDALAALSLTGADRLVRVRIPGDMASLGAMIAEIDSGGLATEARLIIEAGDLKKGSKLRKAAEDAATALAIACYADGARDLLALAEAQLAEEGLSLAPDARAMLAPYLEGDRALARGEVEKLILYKGLSHQRGGEPAAVERADIAAISAAGADAALDQILEPALAGDPARADSAYARAMAAGTNPVAVLRVLQRRIDQIDTFHAGGGDAGALARAGAPRFGPPADAFKRAARNFTGRRLDHARRLAFDAERAVKRSGAPAEAIVGELILRLARAGPSRR